MLLDTHRDFTLAGTYLDFDANPRTLETISERMYARCCIYGETSTGKMEGLMFIH